MYAVLALLYAYAFELKKKGYSDEECKFEIEKFVGRCLRNDSIYYFTLCDPALREADTLYHF